MHHRRLWRIVPAASVAMLVMLVFMATASATGRPFSTPLTGAAEVPGPGDPDGSGFAAITLNPGLGEVCFDITVEDVAPIAAAHIHVGTADVAGPVVVNFNVPVNGLDGCVEADRELIKEIIKSPANYYVNVHNVDFPAGALRGQLSK